MKGRLAAWGCLAALGLLLARSAEAAQAVRDGLALCAGSVIPALFPFLAVSGLLTALDAGASPALGPLARLLGCSRAGARAFLLGLTGSYPVGARTVAQLYRRGGGNEDFFAVSPGDYDGGLVQADMTMSQVRYRRALSQAEEVQEITPDTLTAGYPGLGQSVAQVIHNTDERCKSLQ